MKRRWARTGILAAICTVGMSLAAPAQQRPDPAVLTGQERDIQSSPPGDPALRETLRLIEQRDYTSAAGTIRAYLEAHASSAEGHFLLGYVLYRQDEPRESLTEYTEGARFRKPDANDLAVVAMDYVLLHDDQDADKWLSLATRWSPQDELYWYYLGRTKYAENRFQEAIAIFEKCLTLAPRDIRAEYNMGLAYAGLGRNQAAAADYRTAIAWEQKTGSHDPQPYLDLGMLLLQQGEPGHALPDLQKAVALDGQNPSAREQLGRAWEQLHDLAKAGEEMHAAVTLAPNVSSLHFEMGRIYEKEGQTAQAKAEFARCAALNGTHSTDAEETPNPAPRQ